MVKMRGSLMSSVFAAATSMTPVAQGPGDMMQPGTMTGGWGMVWWSLLGLLLIVCLVLAIVALLKYLRG